MILGSIADAAAELVRRTGCSDRPDRPRRRTTQVRVLLQQRDVGARNPCLDRGGQAGTAASDDDDVEDFFHRCQALLLARPALSRDAAEHRPDMRPVPRDS